MVPAEPAVPPARRRGVRRTRFLLIVMVLGLAAIFVLAAWIRPYDADGSPRSQATHMQLGLPPCSIMLLYGKPCPSCGMTTAFSLLVHGDVANSLRANWVGTLLALAWLAMIPWGIASAIRGKLLGVRSLELTLTVAVGVLLVLMLVRWAFVMLL